MFRISGVIGPLAAIACWSSMLAASEQDIPTIEIPETYNVGRVPAALAASLPPPVVDKAAKNEVVAAASEQETDVDGEMGHSVAKALNGTLYAVIAPVFDGSNVTQSFFRFVNGSSATSTFSVTVVGSPSGDTYGTGMIDVPMRGSPQFSLGGIRDLTGAPALQNGDTAYALYIQNADQGSGYQHVIFNNANSFFENASICNTNFDEVLKNISNSKVLTNVHTSLLAAWPSQVEIHNFWNASVTYLVSVIEAVSGDVMGQVNVQMDANSSYSMPFTFFEDSVGWEPASGELHANLVVSDPTGASPNIVLGHFILNNAFNASLNMSMACAVNEVEDDPLGGGFGGGGFSY